MKNRLIKFLGLTDDTKAVQKIGIAVFFIVILIFYIGLHLIVNMAMGSPAPTGENIPLF